MRRRDFIKGVAGGAAAWPLAARAQQSAKLPTIGYLGGAAPGADGQRVAWFVQQLRELGWVEGRNVTIEYRWAEGRFEQMTEIAAEFVRLKVDVIFTWARRRGAAEKRDELAPFHGLPSSGREPHITTPLHENAAVQCARRLYYL